MWFNVLMEEMVVLKKYFKCECWIEVDMVWYEYIYEMSVNFFLIFFVMLFYLVYYIYFILIIYNEVVKLDLYQVIVDVIVDGDGECVFQVCQVLLIVFNERLDN